MSRKSNARFIELIFNLKLSNRQEQLKKELFVQKILIQIDTVACTEVFSLARLPGLVTLHGKISGRLSRLGGILLRDLY